ncbi:energy transducer TonB [Nonlabens mediterrranea]|uniref:Energy transducer TonB n=1 Tax=Nonlabens mediterrranea TaxID=1419947 RepID=A0ABS0A8Z3_9FLAO|nr:energy transducer TonB [Nonlabens mediterrranea]
MEKFYSLRIPEPCHEDWNQMTSSDKGRHCSSCDQTVIDFTMMSDYEIKDFLMMNQGKKLCGHVKKSQLDLIHIKVPVQALNTYRLGHHSFLLALLIVMGTSLMSCKDDYGNKVKIDQVEVVDSLGQSIDDIPITGGLHRPPMDPSSCKSAIDSTQQDLVEDLIPVVGKLPVPSPPPIVGEIIEIQGGIGWDIPEIPEVPFTIVEKVPRFIDTPNNLTEAEAKEYFQNKIRTHIDSHFNTAVGMDLEGRQRIHTQFIINKSGKIEDVNVRAPKEQLEKETRRVLNLLPDFIPGQQNGEVTSVIYSLPIIFVAPE